MRTGLERSAWLVDLAARDEPPTVIEDKLLARLARAGVDRLVPAIGSDALPPEDAERATAIGAMGPGFGFAESFEAEAAPVAAALLRLLGYVEGFDKLRRFRLAAIDMRLAERTARDLLDRDGPARVFERVLETGLIVTYARPYLTRGRAGVGRKWWPEREADRAFHYWLLDELRHPYHAHADRTPRRTLTDTTAYLGLEGAPTFAEAWWRLTDEQLETLAGIAGRQAERFEAEAWKVGAELGERRDTPARYG